MRTVILLVLLAPLSLSQAQPRDRVVHVALEYRAPGNGPAPNFSPYGTQVPLTAVAPKAALPSGSVRPAKTGTMKIGPANASWIPVLVTADADHPQDFCRLYVDRNRNGNFEDDGPAVIGALTQNDKTKAWWSSFNKVEVTIPYGAGKPEPYLVNFWVVRDDGTPAPDVVRYSVGSWRFGTATVDGISALVAAMDADNDAVFGKNDKWSVLQASAPDAQRAVLSAAEARPTSRFMFLEEGGRSLVLEFRSFSPDGRSIDFAVVDKPMTKAADRAPDDMLAVERSRPRTKAPFAWSHRFDEALSAAKSSGKKVFVDFETTWCGPCKSMDDWIWTDTDVAALLNAGYVGVKLDGDIEKDLVKRFNVIGYPTMLVLDASGKELKKIVGYQSSAQMIAQLKAQ
ncbi:MAG TPA: thioredoxin family protein [Vicinamibacterales bacterium]|nr:thioredoxin family protein [Vicinamibacterales bacterium]